MIEEERGFPIHNCVTSLQVHTESYREERAHQTHKGVTEEGKW